MSIKKSLQTYILLLSTIPVIIVTILAYIIASNKYLDLNQESLKATTLVYKDAFESQISSQLIETESVANLNNVKSYLLDKINDSNISLVEASAYYKPVTVDLTTTAKNYGDNVNYYLYDIDGYLVASSTGSTNSGDWFEYMDSSILDFKTSQVLINAAISTTSHKNSIDIISPVVVNNSTIGILRANINVDYFGSFISNKKGNYILCNDDSFLFGMDDLYESDPVLVEKANKIIDDYIKYNSSKDLSGTITNTGTDGYLMYGYSVISKYNWLYITRQDSSAYRSVISTLPILLIIILFLLLLLSLRVSSHLAKKYTDPIYILKSKMEEASTGQLDVHCDIDTEDEFGQLSTMFNTMMDIISANYKEIAHTKQELETSKESLAANYSRIERLAYHDGLTGLYNRIAFMKYTYDILHSSSSFERHAILFIDLDNFKNVNDTLGHDYGDILLKQIAEKLSSFVDANDILARTGGDEFLIFKSHLSKEDDLESFTKRLVTIANHPFLLDDETVYITMSVGVSFFPQNGLSINELTKNADIAMYSAKTSGKNNYMFFNSTMEDEVNRRSDLIDILRDALDNHEVYLVYQPQADASTGKITGFEALMRLRSSLVGQVAPDEFIPVAEECGLIDELGEWAFTEACSFNKRLMDMGFEPITVSVNLSTSQIRSKTLLSTIANIPEKIGMPLKYLEIELTESVLMKNFEQNLNFINTIRDMGINIALDDFGTGYSSFNYLTKIPINTLKIDKSFVAGITNSQKDRFIASTIITLAHQLNITVIAEGVEDIDQLRTLQSQQCDKLQGYFFSRPILDNDFIQLLKDNR